MKKIMSLLLVVCTVLTMAVFPVRTTAATESHVAMVYNICGPHLEVTYENEIMEIVQSYNPDLVSFNEVNHIMDPIMVSLMADAGYACYGKTDWDPESPEHIVGHGGWVNYVFYKTSKYTLLASGTFSLSETPSDEHAFLEVMDEASRNAEGRPRNCSWVYLQSKATGDTFIYASTHVQWSFTDTVDYNQLGLQILAEQLNSLSDKYSCEVICGGDMNANVEKMTPVLTRGYSIANTGTITYSTDESIDNIIATAGVSLSNFKCGTQYTVSDHKPICATFTKQVGSQYSLGVYKLTSSATVYTAPSSGASLGTISRNTEVTIIETTSSNWAKIIYNGQFGYIQMNTSKMSFVKSSLIPESDIIFDSSEEITWLKNSGTSSSAVSLVDNGDAYAKFVASASNDPWVNMDYSVLGDLSANTYKYMVITARTNSSNINGKLYLCAGNISGATEDCTYYFKWTNDGYWHDYLLDLSAIGNWTGNVNSIRFDYFDGTTAAGSTLDLRSIKFYTSKPASATVTTDKTAYSSDEAVTLNYSNLGTYLSNMQNQKPFVAIYDINNGPSNGTAYMYSYINTDSGSVTFPSGAQGGVAVENLPAGSYSAWLAYDATGTSTAINLNNVRYAGDSATCTFTVSGQTDTGDTDTGNTDVVEQIKNDTVSGSSSAVIKLGSSVADTISALQTELRVSSVTITKDGHTVDASAVIATGMVVTAGTTTYTVIVKGDVDCDGAVTIADASLTMSGLQGKTALTSAGHDAAKELSATKNALNILDVMAILNSL